MRYLYSTLHVTNFCSFFVMIQSCSIASTLKIQNKKQNKKKQKQPTPPFQKKNASKILARALQNNFKNTLPTQIC